VQRLLDRIDAPACVRNGRMDILAMNRLGEALYSEMLANPGRPANSARFCFLDPRATTFFVDWEESADATVAVLRAEAGRNPHDGDLVLFVFTAEAGSKSEEALNLLASWTATEGEPILADTSGHDE
jgi:MmyB-like transcription regulator ligand binding domain